MSKRVLLVVVVTLAALVGATVWVPVTRFGLGPVPEYAWVWQVGQSRVAHLTRDVRWGQLAFNTAFLAAVGVLMALVLHTHDRRRLREAA